MDREHRREAMLAAAARREAAQAAHVPADKVAEAVSKLVRMGFSEGESKTAVDTYHTFEGALKQLMPTRKSKPLAPASTSARHGRPSPFGGGIGYDFGSDDDEEEQEQELELAQADRKEKRQPTQEERRAAAREAAARRFGAAAAAAGATVAKHPPPQPLHRASAQAGAAAAADFTNDITFIQKPSAGAHAPAATPTASASRRAGAAAAASAAAKRHADQTKLDAERKPLSRLTLLFLQKIAAKIGENPTNPKFRRVKLANAKFASTVWAYVPAQALLAEEGWRLDLEEGYLVLPASGGVDKMVLRVKELLGPDPEELAHAAELAKQEHERRERLQMMQKIKQEQRMQKVELKRINEQIKADREKHTKEKVWEALQPGRDPRVLEQLLNAHPLMLHGLDAVGRTPLLIAAACGNEDAVTALLERGAALDVTTATGCTVLHGAALEGHASTVALLVALGCKIDSVDAAQSTPLLLAAGNGHAHAVRVLIDAGADVKVVDTCKRTALNRAALAGNGEAVSALISAGANLQAQDFDAHTPLISSAVNGNEIIVKLLMDSGALIEAVDNKGRTALTHASSKDNANIVAMLLEHGALVDALDIHGATPAWHACEHDSPESLEILLAHGADLAVVERRYEQTPVDVAIASGSYGCIAVLRGVPGLDIPDLPEDDLPHGGRSDGSFTVRKGEKFLDSSLGEIERIVNEGGQIFPQRLRAHYAGEEAYGEGVTRQWIGQFGREMLTFCDREMDRPTSFRVRISMPPHDVTQGNATGISAKATDDGGGGSSADGGGMAAAGGALFRRNARASATAAAGQRQGGGGGGSGGGDATPRASLSIANDFTGSAWDELVLVRGCTYSFFQTAAEFASTPLRFYATPDGGNVEGLAVDVVVAASIVESKVVLPKRGLAKFWLGAEVLPPSPAGVPAVRPVEVAVVDKKLTHCRKHGSVQKSRCAVVVGSSEPLQIDGPDSIPQHLVSLSPMNNPADSRTKTLLVGLGRALGVALSDGCPLGVSLSPSFCKLLVGLDEPVSFDDLAAVLPAAKFKLLQQCLDPSRSLEEREALVDVYVESSDHSTFVTDSVQAMAAAQGLDVESCGAGSATSISMGTEEDDEDGYAGQQPLMRENSAVCEGGEEQLITAQNIGEYVQVLADKLLKTNIAAQMTVVRRGLQDVRGAFAKLRKAGGWKDVQHVFRGAVDIDVAEWKGMTSIESAGGGGGGYGRGRTTSDGGGGGLAQTEAWFWEVVRELTALDRRKLLYFWTSSSPPARGITHLDRRLALNVDPNASQPQAATCFYSLTIPACQTPAEVREVVELCVAHWQSWGTA